MTDGTRLAVGAGGGGGGVGDEDGLDVFRPPPLVIGINSAAPGAAVALLWLKMTPFDHGRIVLLSVTTNPGSVLITTTGSTTDGGGGDDGVLALDS